MSEDSNAAKSPMERIERTIEVKKEDLKAVGNIQVYKYVGLTTFDPRKEYFVTFSNPQPPASPVFTKTVVFANVFETQDLGSGHIPVFGNATFTRSANVATNEEGTVFTASYDWINKLTIGFELLIIEPA